MESRRRVLIVDDDNDLRHILRRLLTKRGWTVAEAADGHEALGRVADDPPDLILLDHRMPGLSGAEVYREMRARRVDVPVVLMTAARDIQVLADALGIPDRIAKPVDVQRLVETLEQAAARRAPGAPAGG